MPKPGEDDHPYEYYETQVESRGEPIDATSIPEPPRQSGGGWKLIERFRAGALVVFRWRRPKASDENQKQKVKVGS
jgi:hypothetical protein